MMNFKNSNNQSSFSRNLIFRESEQDGSLKYGPTRTTFHSEIEITQGHYLKWIIPITDVSHNVKPDFFFFTLKNFEF